MRLVSNVSLTLTCESVLLSSSSSSSSFSLRSCSVVRLITNIVYARVLDALETDESSGSLMELSGRRRGDNYAPPKAKM